MNTRKAQGATTGCQIAGGILCLIALGEFAILWLVLTGVIVP